MSTAPKRGRPPARGERKVTLCVRLTPTLRRYLAQQAQSSGELIEDALRRTAGFRRWKDGHS